MSAIQQAATNTALRIANLFEQNCAFKHGLPKVGGPDRIDEVEPKEDTSAALAAMLIGKLGTDTQPAATAANSSPSPGLGAVAVTGKRSLISRAAPFLITAATGAGIPLGAWALLHEKTPAPIVQPTENPDGSLLQYLQDHGQHLPEGSWPTK